MERSERFWNPYVAGIALGLVLLASFLIAGKGLGASGAAYHLGLAGLEAVAPDFVLRNEYMARSVGGHFDNRLMFMVFGVILGGIVAAYTAGRFKLEVVRGPRIGAKARLGFALIGGLIMGMAARMALGCTSGQALSGGALLSVGSWVFMMALFGGGYGLAYFIRRQWT